MYQNITTADKSKALPLPIPGSTPTISFQPLNLDYAIGPATLLFHFAPGTFIPAHYHKKAKETFYVIEGEFIDDGKVYPAGTFFGCAPGTVHGPHETKAGATVWFSRPSRWMPRTSTCRKSKAEFNL